MLDKIIRSMIYGNTKTKLYLWSIVVLGIAGIVVFIVAVSLHMPMLGFAAVGIGLVDFVISQSVSFNSLQVSNKKSMTEKSLSSSEESILIKNTEHTDEQEDEPTDQLEKERNKARYLASMDKKKLKKLWKQYHVKQNHVCIMIDSYPERKLSQVPAFVWKEGGNLKFLVLEGRANLFEIPLSQIQGVYYQKNIDADPQKEYIPFQYKNLISKMFSMYLPEYHEKNDDGELKHLKNLFLIHKGLAVTNTSAANLMNVLGDVSFIVEDGVCKSPKFDVFFKELYRNSILCKNQVISLEEYKLRSQNTLEELLVAPIPSKQFVESLRSMNKYRLITQEQMLVYSQKYREMKL